MQPDLVGVSRYPRFVWEIQCFQCRWQVWVLGGEGGRWRFIGCPQASSDRRQPGSHL